MPATTKPRRSNKSAAPDTDTSPVGLCAVIRALTPDGYNAAFARDVARDVQSEAMAIAQLNEFPHGDYSEHVFSVTERMYPSRETERSKDSPVLAADAGFWLGVATCWYVMTALNGAKEGAR